MRFHLDQHSRWKIYRCLD